MKDKNYIIAVIVIAAIGVLMFCFTGTGSGGVVIDKNGIQFVEECETASE